MNNTRYCAASMTPLALAALLGGMPAQAATFNIGEIEGSFDSTLSIGASWALRDADRNFIGVANGGNASTRTADDGRLNFQQGETFSKIFKGLHDLKLSHGDSGVFLRGKYWYDFELKDEDHPLYAIDDHGRDRAAQSSGAQLLDAFVYHNYAIADLPGSARAGKQVLSWGESTFIGNSINSINPLDAAAFRRPGAEIKEGLIPVQMLYVTQGLSDDLSVEAFYQLQWEKTVLDNCGTFFASDTAAQGCDLGMTVNGSDYQRSANPANVRGGFGYVPRLADQDARDSGQFGVALHWTVAALNETEFGLYAINQHSSTPASMWLVGKGALRDPVGGLVGQGGVSSARYYLQYPEDVRLYGLSFSTTVGDTAVSGEISHRPNMPLALNGTDLSAAATFGAAATNPLVNAGLPIFTTGWASSQYGSTIQGYQRMPFTQAQLTAVHSFDQVLAADRLSLVAEVGVSHIGDLGPTDGSALRFGRNSVYGNGQLASAGTAAALGGIQGNAICAKFANTANPDQCTDDGFYTQYSWGYRLRAALEYNDALAGVNLKPNLSLANDVKGYGPTFNQGNQAASIGLDADYLTNYTASLSYTDYFGGDFNANTDRDFLALSFGVSF